MSVTEWRLFYREGKIVSEEVPITSQQFHDRFRAPTPTEIAKGISDVDIEKFCDDFNLKYHCGRYRDEPKLYGLLSFH